MIRYIKSVNGVIEEAPYQKKVGECEIYGYNKPTNEEMLLADGYLKYEGNYPLSMLEIEDGEIIENIPEPVVEERMIFTKLEIRRAARAIGKEALLNSFLNESETFKADWNDAQEINLQDEVFLQAIQEIPEGASFLNEIKEYLNNDSI